MFFSNQVKVFKVEPNHFFRVGPKVEDNMIFIEFAEVFKTLSATNNCIFLVGPIVEDKTCSLQILLNSIYSSLSLTNNYNS